MVIRPRQYTDGVDRIVVQVKHKIDREQFIGTLAFSYPSEHGEVERVAPLSQARAIYYVHRELAISGRFAGEAWADPVWVAWAREQTDRLWPERNDA